MALFTSISSTISLQAGLIDSRVRFLFCILSEMQVGEKMLLLGFTLQLISCRTQSVGLEEEDISSKVKKS